MSDIAGTTRDTIDTLVENKYGKFNFTDTAGLRRQSKYMIISKNTVLSVQKWLLNAVMCALL